MGMKLSVFNQIYVNQTCLIRKCLKMGMFETCEIFNLQNETDVYGWYSVSYLLAERLLEKGEPVIISDNLGCWWGCKRGDVPLADDPILNEIEYGSDLNN